MWSIFKRKKDDDHTEETTVNPSDIADKRERDIDAKIEKIQHDQSVTSDKGAEDMRKLNELIDKHGMAGLLYGMQGGKFNEHR